MVFFLFVLAIIFSVAINVAVAGLVLWAVGLFFAGFTWTWAQALGLAIIFTFVRALFAAK